MKRWMNAQKPAVAVVGLVLLATPGFAEGFSDQLGNGFNIVSPAQIHQVQTTKFESAVLVNSATNTSTAKTDATKTEQESTFNDLYAGAYYRLSQLVIGADVGYGTQELEIGSVTSDSTVLRASPKASFDVMANLTLGVQWDYFQTSFDDENTEGVTGSRFLTGITYHNQNLELGLLYRSKIDEDDVKDGSSAAIQGRYRLAPTVALGAVAEYMANSETNAKDVALENRDSMNVRIIGEVKALEDLEIEAAIAYRGATYRDKEEDLNADNMQKYSVAVAGDYTVASRGSVGLFTSYTFGSESNQVADYDASDWMVGVRGSYQL